MNLKALAHDDLILLAKLLGRRNSFFLPARAGDMRALKPRVCRWEHRHQYHQTGGGIPWVSGGTAVERKAAQRQIEQMQSLGVVRSIKRDNRRILLAIHEDIELPLSALCDCRTPDEGHVLMQMLLLIGGPELAWVNEIPLTDEPEYNPERSQQVGEALVLVADLLLPAILRGWVETNSSNQGHVYYRLSSVGVAVAEADPPVKPDDLPDVDWDCAYERQEEQFRYRDYLRVAEPYSKNECGPCALPVSMIPYPNWPGPLVKPEAAP